MAESILQKQLVLGELLDLQSFTNVCKTFVDLYKIGLKVFDASGTKLVDMKVVYDETPDQMVTGVVPLLEAGASIIGGCCGSTPDHIRAFRHAMDLYRTAKVLR